MLCRSMMVPAPPLAKLSKLTFAPVSQRRMNRLFNMTRGMTWRAYVFERKHTTLHVTASFSRRTCTVAKLETSEDFQEGSVYLNSINFILPMLIASVILESGEEPSYSLASYYTSLGLFLLSVPGVWSLVKRSTKSKVCTSSTIMALLAGTMSYFLFSDCEEDLFG